MKSVIEKKFPQKLEEVSKVSRSESNNHSQIFVNLSRENLIEEALKREEGYLLESGAFATFSGKRTGRSPKDRYIVNEPTSSSEIDWNGINIPIEKTVFDKLWSSVSSYLHKKDRFVSYLHVGASSAHYIPFKITTETAWHSLFSLNMFIKPYRYNESDFLEWEILHSASYICDPDNDGTNSEAAAIIDFSSKRILLAGLQYAGEIKKAMFSVQNFLLPTKRIMPMHCAANTDKNGKTALFFGLSGTGKTTLSADPKRLLIGDDEHAWGPGAVFNMEGGCYAKTNNLSKANEPLIWGAIKQGSILENVKIDKVLRKPIFNDTSITENGRCSYPLSHIEGRSSENYGNEPKHIIFLTCDITGILPPVSVLTKEAAAYHFISGYTAKMGSTETGNNNGIEQIFSACFGAPFMPRRANEYANLFIDRVSAFDSNVYLVNTGWTGGSLGEGKRFPIPTTRAIIRAIINDELINVETENLDILNLNVPKSVRGVASAYLNPIKCWQDKEEYMRRAKNLTQLFKENMKRFDISDSIVKAGP